MPERKKRKTGTSTKRKKQIGASARAKSLLLKEIESLSRFPAENPNAVMRISKDGNVLYSNNAGSPILNEWKSQVGQPVPAEWRQLVADVFRLGEKREVEEKHDGQTFLMMYVPITEAGYVNIYARDITERKKMEEAIKENQKTFTELIERAPFGVYIVDSQFRIAQMNIGSQNGAFRNVRPVIGRDFSEVMHILWSEPVAAEIIANFRRTLETGEPYYSPKFINPRRDVETVESYEWELHRITLPDGQNGVVCYYFDSTKLREAEEALRQGEREFKSLAVNAPDVIVRFDRNLRILYLNPQVERATGIPAEQYIGKTNEEMGMPPELVELWNDMFHKAASSKELQQAEFDFQAPIGKRTFSLRIVPEFAEDGSLASFLGISHDITDIKKAEEELRKARDELETRVLERTGELKKASDELQAEIAERKKAYLEVGVRADQQAVVAQLGQLAVAGSDLNDLFNETVKRVAQTLNVEYCKILELLPNEKELLLRAGVGWKEGLVGHATVGTGMDSQAGYTLSTDEPVVVEDLKAEKRFNGPPLLVEHQVVSGLSVIVPSRGKPFGVLGVHTTKRRKFTGDDIVFLQAVANVLGTAIEHKQAEEAVDAERNRFTDVLEKLPAYLVLLTPDYHVSYANRFFRERFGENRDGKRCFEHLFGRSEPCETCETYKTLKKMSPLEWEWTGPDGRNYYIYDSPFTDIDGSTLIMEVGIDITERKKAEMKLHEASLYARSLIEASLDPLVTINAEGKITDVNKATEEATGNSREQLIGSDFSDYFTDPEEARKGYRQVFAEGFVRDYPLAIRHKSGKTADVLYNASVYQNEAGEIQGVFAAARDITERKKAEESLHKAHEELETRVEERTRELKQSTWELQGEVAERRKAEEGLRETREYLENLIDYANAPIIVWDPNYRITRFNHAFERLTGLKAEDAIGKQLEILFPEDSKGKSLEHILRATSGARWETEEIPILRTDGSVRTVLWNSANILGKDGTTPVATIAQGEDITERKQALESLRESQRDLTRAQAVAKTGSWRLDVRNNALLWSDETHRMFGIPKGTSLTYETFLNSVHADDREYVDKRWQAAIHGGETYDIEHRIVADGRVKWVHEKAELEFGNDGVLVGGFGTVQEITEIKEMQAKLEEYSQHLEQLVEEKTQKLKEAERLATIGETAGMVGHDIRNPLQSIEGAVYLAREEIKALPDGSSEKRELSEVLEIIRHQTNYIDHIVADLQDFSRTPMPQLRETDLQELVTEAVSTVDIPENIELQTLMQDDLRRVKVDPVFIKRVILNLVENAAHAMPNGGKLTIRGFYEDGWTHLHVEDTGIGISEENKAKVFTPLFTTKSKGQGFGLAVCKKLVEAHSGEISFESEAGKGTVFKIKLPQGEQESKTDKSDPTA